MPLAYIPSTSTIFLVLKSNQNKEEEEAEGKTENNKKFKKKEIVCNNKYFVTFPANEITR